MHPIASLRQFPESVDSVRYFSGQVDLVQEFLEWVASVWHFPDQVDLVWQLPERVNSVRHFPEQVDFDLVFLQVSGFSLAFSRSGRLGSERSGASGLWFGNFRSE
jgi:hypothetical protein